jgi:hypothetical protein
MFPQPNTQLVQWQDFKVRSEVDVVFEIARQKGWKDCEIFGHGDMITQPQDSMGWKLIPADLYEYSIPARGVDRVLQIVNEGVRIQGIIIADDQRRKAPSPTPAKPAVSLPSAATVLSFVGKALLGLIMIAGFIAFATSMIFFAPLALLMCLMPSYDPKLIILVDDGNGGTAWVSILTWYD